MAQHVALEYKNRYCDVFTIRNVLLDGRSHIANVAVDGKVLWTACLQETRAWTIVFADRKLRRTYFTQKKYACIFNYYIM